MMSNDAVARLGLLVASAAFVIQILAWLMPRPPRAPGSGVGAGWRLLGLGLCLAVAGVIAARYVVATPFSHSALERIRARGHITIGVNDNAPPFSFKTATGPFEGFEVDIGKAINQAIFDDDRHAPRFVAMKGAERFDPAILKGNEVDLVISLLSSDIDQDRRKDVLAFSRPYYLTGQRILVRRGSNVAGAADLRGRRACVAPVTQTASAANLAAAVPGVVTETRSAADCLSRLRARSVDAVSSDEWLLLSLIRLDPVGDLELRGRPITKDLWGIGVRKDQEGHEDLLAFVNTVLDDLIRSGRWGELYEEWVEPLSHEHPAPPPATI